MTVFMMGSNNRADQRPTVGQFNYLQLVGLFSKMEENALPHHINREEFKQGLLTKPKLQAYSHDMRSEERRVGKECRIGV